MARQVYAGTTTRVPRTQETATHYDPAAGLYLGPYGGPRGGGISYERGTLVAVLA